MPTPPSCRRILFGMHYARHQIAEALKAVLGDSLQNIYYKSEATLPYKANLGSEDGYLYGGEVEDIALENGLKFCVDWQKGQKTGFFVDQRENRSLLERYCQRTLRTEHVLLHWRFSFYAMRGRSQGRSLGRQLCQSDLADQQERGIELSRRSAPRSLCGRRFQISRKDGKQLRSHHPGIHQAFAKHKNVLRNALQGYRKLNAIAFEKIKPGGILFTFSCSQVVSKKTSSGRYSVLPPSPRAQCPHPAPTDTTRRPSGQHLPSGREISERAGTLCRVRRGMNYDL